MDDDVAIAIVETVGAGEMVTSSDDGLEASYLPFHAEVSGSGGLRALTTHIAAVNPQRRHDGAEALVLFRGPDTFIPSAWLSDPDEGLVVGASWDYLTVQVRGHLVIHEDEAWIRAQLRRHGESVEPDFDFDELSEDYWSKMGRALVGVEIVVDSLVGKAKMHQNKTPEAIHRIIAGLRAHGRDDVADWMATHSLAHAEARRDLIESLRQGD